MSKEVYKYMKNHSYSNGNDFEINEISSWLNNSNYNCYWSVVPINKLTK